MFEARLLLVLAVVASALGHGVGLFSVWADPVVEERIELEFLTPPPPGASGDGLATVAAAAPVTTAPIDAPAAPRGWRAKWAAREIKFAADDAVHQQNIAALGPPGESDEGAPIALCSDGGHRAIAVDDEKDVEHWGGLVPTGLFEAAYMEGMVRIWRGGDRLGALELALPARTITVPLDEPENAVVEIGRFDARCVVGIRYSEGIFPILLRGVPARISHDGVIASAVIDVDLHEDGTLRVRDRSGKFGVSRASLYSHEVVSRRLRMFYSGASLFLR